MPAMSTSDNTSQKLQELFVQFNLLHERALKDGVSTEDLFNVCIESKFCKRKLKEPVGSRVGYGASSLLSTAILFLVIGLMVAGVSRQEFVNAVFGVRCVIPNNFLVWEATRPIMDCGICRGVNSVIVLHNVTREEFKPYAYSQRPIIVKNAASLWPAMKSFTYDYFKELYEKTEGAYESVEEECQLLTFKTEFVSLKEVFNMSRSRVLNARGEQPWYIGWSNCHSSVLAEMRSQYPRPPFLPADAEHAYHDFVFMGYTQGASMHLDYISRLMWQAQLRGHKTWVLSPPPECEPQCSTFSFQADPGDVVLLDTRQWYHKTQIDGGKLSLTISSEYG